MKDINVEQVLLCLLAIFFDIEIMWELTQTVILINHGIVPKLPAHFWGLSDWRHWLRWASDFLSRATSARLLLWFWLSEEWL